MFFDVKLQSFKFWTIKENFKLQFYSFTVLQFYSFTVTVLLTILSNKNTEFTEKSLLQKLGL